MIQRRVLVIPHVLQEESLSAAIETCRQLVAQGVVPVLREVDGVAVAAQSSEELTKLVLGAEGSRVALDILRNGEKS